MSGMVTAVIGRWTVSRSRDWLIVNLDIAREFFGVNSRSTLWDRMRGR